MVFKRPTKKASTAALLLRKERVVPSLFRIDDSFERINKPGISDWLSGQTERGQTVRSFQVLSMRCQPHGYVNTIELVVIGPWDPNRAPKLEDIVR